METDADLLELWKAGDNKAGSRLVERHFRPICRFFRSKLGDDVQDIVQRTFLDCVRSHERIDLELGFRTFVFTVAQRRLVDELRRRGRRPEFDPARDSLVDAGVSPSGVMAQQEQTRLLQRAMPRLPLEQQVTLELFYWEDMSGREIARVLGVSEHTVRSRLARAKGRLKEELERLASDESIVRSTLDGLDGFARNAGDLALPEL